jgi:hypothetical protein
MRWGLLIIASKNNVKINRAPVIMGIMTNLKTIVMTG